MSENHKRRAKITGFGFTLIGVLAITIFMFFNFKTVVVTGNSMEPTYTNKERVLVSKAYWLVGDIRQKDVIVFRDPSGEEVIKRVYGLPGDKIDFFNTPEEWNISSGEYVVPTGKYYVIGDNREVSEDSRKFGPIELKQILGKVIANR
jgi:signal peptidase I